MWLWGGGGGLLVGVVWCGGGVIVWGWGWSVGSDSVCCVGWCRGVGWVAGSAGWCRGVAVLDGGWRLGIGWFGVLVGGRRVGHGGLGFVRALCGELLLARFGGGLWFFVCSVLELVL